MQTHLPALFERRQRSSRRRTSHVWSACLLLVLCLVWSSSAEKAKAATPRKGSTAGLLLRVTKKLQQVRTYDAQLETTVLVGPRPVRVKLHVWGKPGRRLGLKMNSAFPGGKLTVQATYDGTWQHVQIQASRKGQTKLRRTAYRIRLKPLVSAQRPFATGLAIQGTGLFGEEGLIATLRLMLRLYHFRLGPDRLIGKTPCTTLIGELSRSRFSAYAKQVSAGAWQTNFSQRISRHLTLYIGKKDHFPRGYRIGKDANTPLVEVRLLRFTLNKPLPKDAFRLKPLPGVPVHDRTAQLLRFRAHKRAAAKKERDKTRKKLHKKTQRR